LLLGDTIDRAWFCVCLGECIATSALAQLPVAKCVPEIAPDTEKLRFGGAFLLRQLNHYWARFHDGSFFLAYGRVNISATGSCAESRSRQPVNISFEIFNETGLQRRTQCTMLPSYQKAQAMRTQTPREEKDFK
jgi:hypothetical protein